MAIRTISWKFIERKEVVLRQIYIWLCSKLSGDAVRIFAGLPRSENDVRATAFYMTKDHLTAL